MLRRLYDWYSSTLGHAMVGAAVLWAALPPLGVRVLPWAAPARWGFPPLGPYLLAWAAPAWWVLLARRDQLAGRRPYRALWLVGFLFWLAALHWLRLPHWATSFGWVASSFYLAFYLPVFVGLTRVAVHQLHLPVILAAPVVWTGLELARGRLLTGITMASLGHTQYRWIELIQLSDLAGAYGVSFVVMLVAACLARMVPVDGRPRAIWPLAPAAVAVGAALLYGHLRVSDGQATPVARIALIQGSIDSQFKADSQMRDMVHEHYSLLSYEAAQEYEDLDLIIWPETMYREEFLTYQPNAFMPEFYKRKNWSQEQFQAALKKEDQQRRDKLSQMARRLGVPLILGLDTRHFSPEGVEFFNSVVFVPTVGEVQGPYHKMHLVIFGEYVPFARYSPWLYRLTPLGIGLSEGKESVAFELSGLRIAPNICYETVVPHVIRRQVNTLKAKDAEPDVLVNLTNDGWFWGSSELEMHLVCGVFRAVECRKPLLIAANTGISASIDADGRIIEDGPRRHRGPQPDANATLDEVQLARRRSWCREYGDWPAGTAKILAEVCPDRRGSWYLDHGDWPAGICLAVCVVLAAVGLRGRIRSGAAGYST